MSGMLLGCAMHAWNAPVVISSSSGSAVMNKGPKNLGHFFYNRAEPWIAPCCYSFVSRDVVVPRDRGEAVARQRVGTTQVGSVSDCMS